MPVIPITSRSDPRFADAPTDAQGMPSETNLLMALAEMQRQGRFNKPMDITPKVPPSNPKEWGWKGSPQTLTGPARSKDAIY